MPQSKKPGKALKTGLVADDRCKLHSAGPHHEESPARLDAIRQALAQQPLAGRLLPIAPRPAADEDILACHERALLEHVRRSVEEGASSLGWADTNISAGSWDAALLAAGGVMAAVDAVMAGEVANAFCAVRPPGHHATPSRSMGFCLFNNVAIAARYAQKRHTLARVLIVDWDVHHGNGTQEIFYADPSVFYFSIHQAWWYPGTGKPEEIGARGAEGTTMNRPLPAGAGGAETLAAFEEMRLAMEEFRPDLVLISAGFDSRAGDPLGGLMLEDEDFARMTRVCMDIAARFAGGRLVSALEGGYSLSGLARGVAAHVGELTR